MSMIGTGGSSSVTQVRSFLRADSAEMLVRAQLQNNLKYQAMFSYTDFAQSPVDQKWYCWFLVDVVDLERENHIRTEVNNGASKESV